MQSIMLYYECKKIGGEISIEGLMQDEKAYVEKAEWVDISGLREVGIAASVDFRPFIKQVYGEMHGN